MQIGSNEVAEFYRIKHIQGLRLFTFVHRKTFIHHDNGMNIQVDVCLGYYLHMSFTKEFYRHWSHLGTSTPLEALDELWEALQCLPMQGWVVQRSLQWYHLSSSNLKLFLVWTQLCQAGKLFFCIFTLFPQHRTSLDRMQWYAVAKPLVYALTMHMALHVVSARNRIQNPVETWDVNASHKNSTTLQQSTVFPFSCARKASTGKSTVSARSVRDLGEKTNGYRSIRRCKPWSWKVFGAFFVMINYRYYMWHIKKTHHRIITVQMPSIFF